MARYVELLDALKKRGVIRTTKVVADYTEAVVIRALGLSPAEEGTRGYDAVDPATEARVQIKARQVGPKVYNVMVGPFRDLEADLFDELVGVVLDPSFAIRRAVRVPRDVVRAKAIWVEYDRGWRLQLGPELAADPAVVDVTERLRALASSW